MKYIVFTFLLCLAGTQLYSNNTTVPTTPSSSASYYSEADLYSYTFTIAGIDQYGYKPFIDFIESTFGKRPVYNEATGRFNDANGMFQIVDCSINITQASFTQKISELGLEVTSFTTVAKVSTNPSDHK